MSIINLSFYQDDLTAQDFIFRIDDSVQLYTAALLLKLTVSWWHQEVTPGSQSLKLGDADGDDMKKLFPNSVMDVALMTWNWQAAFPW